MTAPVARPSKSSNGVANHQSPRWAGISAVTTSTLTKPISGPTERSMPPAPERIAGETAMAPITSGTATLAVPVRKRVETMLAS